jgi:hypothetical protein
VCLGARGSPEDIVVRYVLRCDSKEFFGRLNAALTWLDVGVPRFATQLGTP